MDKDNVDDFMLTTFDNPFNPFEDFESWHKEDLLLGHDCCGLLATYSATSIHLNDGIIDSDIDNAMAAIVGLDPYLYRVVDKDMNTINVR